MGGTIVLFEVILFCHQNYESCEGQYLSLEWMRFPHLPYSLHTICCKQEQFFPSLF